MKNYHRQFPPPLRFALVGMRCSQSIGKHRYPSVERNPQYNLAGYTEGLDNTPYSRAKEIGAMPFDGYDARFERSSRDHCRLCSDRLIGKTISGLRKYNCKIKA